MGAEDGTFPSAAPIIAEGQAVDPGLCRSIEMAHRAYRRIIGMIDVEDVPGPDSSIIALARLCPLQRCIRQLIGLLACLIVGFPEKAAVRVEIGAEGEFARRSCRDAPVY